MKNHRLNIYIRITSKTEFRIFSSLLFIIVFIYFSRYANHVLFFQEQQSLLVYLPEYLRKFIEKPGGILEFAGRFLTQFYLNSFAGAFIIASVLTLIGITLYRINSRLNPNFLFTTFTALIPPCALLLMQSHYHYQMVYCLGYLFIFICFLFLIKNGRSRARYAYPVLLPVIYYIAAGYALIFTCLYIVYSYINEVGVKKIVFPIYIIATAFLTIIISEKFLFIQPLKQLLAFPLPAVNDQVNRLLSLLLTGFIILYPLLFLKKTNPEAVANIFFKLTGTIAASLLLALTIYTLINKYNPQVALVINLEKYATEEEWHRVIRTHETYPSKNKIGQYFYNVALSETGQLCDRMFSGEQDFGVNALFMPWDDEHLNWGAYAFYSIGLINEAHRWAYEEMVVNGFRPQNLKMLVKTNLINGNYKMVYKYTGILKRTIFYRKWAGEYERVAGDTAEISTIPSIAYKKGIMPHDNFFIFLETPHENLPLLVESNPKNLKAFEYLTAWLLLNKDVETVVRNIPKMKELGYTQLPRHIEEAVMIYLNTKGALPDPGGFTISYATIERFNRYVSAYSSLRQRNALESRTLEPEFGNTYWFYYHFRK